MADEFIRPSGDTTLDGWTDEADGTTTIYTKIDESTAGDSDYVMSPVLDAAQADLVVRLLQGSTEIAEWTHTDVSETFTTAEQTLTSPQLAAISDFNDLNIELDDNAGSVYKFALGNPAGALTTPVVVSYRYKKMVVEDVIAATTWNSADKTSNLTLSNSDRTVTYNTTGNQNANVRSVAPIATGQKVYIEHVITSMVTNFGIGFCTIGTSFAGPASGIATPSTAFGFGVVNGKFQCNDSVNGTDNFFTPCAAGDRIGIAYDATAGKAWARKNGGGWNTVKGGAQDPAAGTGGAVVPSMGTLYVHCGLDANTGDAITTNFASTDWADTAPSGFTQVSA